MCAGEQANSSGAGIERGSTQPCQKVPEPFAATQTHIQEHAITVTNAYTLTGGGGLLWVGLSASVEKGRVCERERERALPPLHFKGWI